MTDDERAYAPHCDRTILHAPGKCVYCDHFPEWQEYRKVAQIAFTGDDNELGVKRVLPDPQSPNAIEDFVPGIAPCPSTWFRAMDAQMASFIAPPGGESSKAGERYRLRDLWKWGRGRGE